MIIKEFFLRIKWNGGKME